MLLRPVPCGGYAILHTELGMCAACCSTNDAHLSDGRVLKTVIGRTCQGRKIRDGTPLHRGRRKSRALWLDLSFG
jgi:hypothetical protein